jgi:capsule biosynthesis phosphatase
MIYCFDLDDTICFPNHGETSSYEKYGLAKPNVPMIYFINRTRSKGHKIIIHTARRMLTHNGDLSKIKEDVGQITKDWLDSNGVSYDELIFGKPYADFYVDDKNLLIRDLI